MLKPEEGEKSQVRKKVELRSPKPSLHATTHRRQLFFSEKKLEDVDENRYATKKTIAQGCFDLALLTANVSELKYVLVVGQRHVFYSLMLGLLGASIVLQIVVACLCIAVVSINLKKHLIASTLNDLTVILIFLILVINVVLNSFGMHYSDFSEEANHTLKYNNR